MILGKLSLCLCVRALTVIFVQIKYQLMYQHNTWHCFQHISLVTKTSIEQ